MDGEKKKEKCLVTKHFGEWMQQGHPTDRYIVHMEAILQCTRGLTHTGGTRRQVTNTQPVAHMNGSGGRGCGRNNEKAHEIPPSADAVTQLLGVSMATRSTK